MWIKRAAAMSVTILLALLAMTITAAPAGSAKPSELGHYGIHNDYCTTDQSWSVLNDDVDTSGEVTLKGSQCLRADGELENVSYGPLCVREWLRWWDTTGENTLVDVDITEWMCGTGKHTDFAGKPGDGDVFVYANWLSVWIEWQTF